MSSSRHTGLTSLIPDKNGDFIGGGEGRKYRVCMALYFYVFLFFEEKTYQTRTDILLGGE